LFFFNQNALKLTYDHLSFQKIFRGLYPRTPAYKGKGQWRGEGKGEGKAKGEGREGGDKGCEGGEGGRDCFSDQVCAYDVEPTNFDCVLPSFLLSDPDIYSSRFLYADRFL
jgi:hypothetical protein